MNFPKDELPPELQSLAANVEDLAKERQGNCLELLQLLRLLEELHRDIHDSLFQESLPDSRQALYALLQDIEASGSWPYIPRMHIRALLQNLSAADLNPGLQVIPPYPPN
ncbi:hypothetical protein [Synechococcus sp. PCC 7336]|uniref:hypothetical protein n=1 Tax=Synechococcus sp. PCC 7336 TaxID=195250 RepID=UPI00034D8DE0|nr:hypothetical protein [Synechococcus sp. PCC 7336]